jgi:DNA-binding response OmpR family regulator
METVLSILAVDNEPSVTLSLRYIFAGPRYQLTAVESGNDALAKLDAHSDRYDVIIVDQKMPELTGVELVAAIRKRRVTSKIMVLSAQLSAEIREAYERMDVHVMFAKPFDIAELRSAVNCLAA